MTCMEDETKVTQQPSNAEGDKTPENDKDDFNEDEFRALPDDEKVKKMQTLNHQRRSWRDKAIDPATKKPYKEILDASKKPENKKTEDTTVVPDKPADGQQIAEKPEKSKEVLDTLTNLERDKFLKGVPEEKRDIIKKTYGALVADISDLTPEDVGGYMTIAMNANNVRPPISSDRQIMRQAHGAVPKEGKKALSPEQESLAKKFGNDPKDLENIDYSDMAGADRLLSEESAQQQRSNSVI